MSEQPHQTGQQSGMPQYPNAPQYPAAPQYPDAQQYQQYQGAPQFQSAPPVNLPPDPGATPVDNALRLVIILMFVNLGLSVVLTIFTLIFHNSLVDYELAHTTLPPNATPEQIDLVRNSLSAAVWGRLVGVVVVSIFYVWRAFALRRGSRGAYLRLIWICVIGVLGIIYLLVAAQYPIWFRVEQIAQGLVLVAMFIAVLRPEVRYRFAKRPLG